MEDAARENAHRRSKQPQRVRRALLDHAARIAVGEGLAAVTVQAVSDAAGVTKGGFMHHFPSKQNLLETLFREMLAALSRELDERIAADPEPRGAFTRAYLLSVLDSDPAEQDGSWIALCAAMLAEPSLRALWRDWFGQQVGPRRETDGDARLETVRLAADGIWLADLAGVPVADRAGLRAHLLAMTRLP